MPIYQYVCSKCDTNFELKQSFNDDTVAICPKCNGQSRRLFVPVPIIFKGPGFYVTDNKSTSEAQLPAEEAGVDKETTSLSKVAEATEPVALTKTTE